MKPNLLLLGLLGFASLTGCSDKSDPSTPAKSSTSGGNPITAPVDYLGAVANAQKSTSSKLSMVGIQQAIQAYQAQEGHLPKTLNDLVTAQVMGKLPDAPNGMKFSYDPKTGEVKVVPK
jgi:hypothetical protein